MKRNFQILRSLIRNLTWRAVKMFLTQPLFTLPTIWATIESISLTEKHFEDDSGGNGPANAFRHAAWNMLIAYYCTKITSENNALQWAKKVTDLHEEIFINQDFDREMDLHNNRIGRELFETYKKQKIHSKIEMIHLLKEKSFTAYGTQDENEFENHCDEMVYFKEDTE